MKNLVIAIIVVAVIGVVAGVRFLPRPSVTPPPAVAPTSTSSGPLSTPTSTAGSDVELQTPAPGMLVSSPVKLSGKIASGYAFEATFPIAVTDANGKVLGQGQGHVPNWTEPGFQDFTAEIQFSKPSTQTGFIVFSNDNPSGDPARSKSVKVLVAFTRPTSDICGGMSYSAAAAIAKSACGDTGTLASLGTCNPNSNTWWIDLTPSEPKAGCNPACVIDAKTKTAEINWRCTGAIPPTPGILPYQEGLKVNVLLGPTCPVERIPPDPQCAPKPYQTEVTVFRSSDLAHPYAATPTDARGEATLSLAPGDYVIRARGGVNFYPRCAEQTATVTPGIFAPVTISCDTGIR